MNKNVIPEGDGVFVSLLAPTRRPPGSAPSVLRPHPSVFIRASCDVLSAFFHLQERKQRRAGGGAIKGRGSKRVQIPSGCWFNPPLVLETHQTAESNRFKKAFEEPPHTVDVADSSEGAEPPVAVPPGTRGSVQETLNGSQRAGRPSGRKKRDNSSV